MRAVHVAVALAIALGSVVLGGIGRRPASGGTDGVPAASLYLPWLARDAATAPTAGIRSLTGGPVRGVAIRGNVAWLAAGSSVVAVDVGGSADPRQLGQSPPLPGEVTHIEAYGSLIVVSVAVPPLDVGSGRPGDRDGAPSAEHLAVLLDGSDRRAMRVLDTLELGGRVLGLAGDGDLTWWLMDTGGRDAARGDGAIDGGRRTVVVTIGSDGGRLRERGRTVLSSVGGDATPGAAASPEADGGDARAQRLAGRRALAVADGHLAACGEGLHVAVVTGEGAVQELSHLDRPCAYPSLREGGLVVSVDDAEGRAADDRGAGLSGYRIRPDGALHHLGDVRLSDVDTTRPGDAPLDPALDPVGPALSLVVRAADAGVVPEGTLVARAAIPLPPGLRLTAIAWDEDGGARTVGVRALDAVHPTVLADGDGWFVIGGMESAGSEADRSKAVHPGSEDAETDADRPGVLTVWRAPGASTGEPMVVRARSPVDASYQDGRDDGSAPTATGRWRWPGRRPTAASTGRQGRGDTFVIESTGSGRAGPARLWRVRYGPEGLVVRDALELEGVGWPAACADVDPWRHRIVALDGAVAIQVGERVHLIVTEGGPMRRALEMAPGATAMAGSGETLVTIGESLIAWDIGRPTSPRPVGPAIELGSPALGGQPLDIAVDGGHAWVLAAEGMVLHVDLEPETGGGPRLTGGAYLSGGHIDAGTIDARGPTAVVQSMRDGRIRVDLVEGTSPRWVAGYVSPSGDEIRPGVAMTDAHMWMVSDHHMLGWELLGATPDLLRGPLPSTISAGPTSRDHADDGSGLLRVTVVPSAAPGGGPEPVIAEGGETLRPALLACPGGLGVWEVAAR